MNDNHLGVSAGIDISANALFRWMVEDICFLKKKGDDYILGFIIRMLQGKQTEDLKKTTHLLTVIVNPASTAACVPTVPKFSL